MRNDPYDRKTPPEPPKKPRQLDNFKTMLKQLFFKREIREIYGGDNYMHWDLREWWIWILAINGLVLAACTVWYFAVTGVATIDDDDREGCKTSCLVLDHKYVETTDYGCFCRTDDGNVRLPSLYSEVKEE